MKLVWLGLGLFLALCGLGLACGPKDHYCYDGDGKGMFQGQPCSQVAKDIAMMQQILDAGSDAMDGIGESIVVGAE